MLNPSCPACQRRRGIKRLAPRSADFFCRLCDTKFAHCAGRSTWEPTDTGLTTSDLAGWASLAAYRVQLQQEIAAVAEAQAARHKMFESGVFAEVTNLVKQKI